VLLAWWLSLAPRNDRNWYRDVRVTPTAELDGDRLTVHGVRNFTYRSETDWDEHWEDRTYDLAKLRGLDLFMAYWGSPTIAHTIMSWEFEGGLPLAISIETRKEQGESYSAVRGFFRQYELYYVVADERDVIGLRTNQRGEQVFLYRLRTPRTRARQLLLSYVDAMNRLAKTPEWYNAFTHNCTTTIELHTRHVVTDGGPARSSDQISHGYCYIDPGMRLVSPGRLHLPPGDISRFLQRPMFRSSETGGQINGGGESSSDRRGHRQLRSLGYRVSNDLATHHLPYLGVS